MILRRDAMAELNPQHSGVSTDLTAGAAPSATVWLGRRPQRNYIRTTDGEHWDLVASPTGDNLVRVASDSAEHAVITTAAGQNFAPLQTRRKLASELNQPPPRDKKNCT